MITSDLSKSIAIMHCAKYLPYENTRLMLYYPQYMPSLSYLCEVWGNTYKTHIDCIYLLQK